MTAQPAFIALSTSLAEDLASHGYVVTPLGADLLKRMAELPTFATKWVNSQAKKAV